MNNFDNSSRSRRAFTLIELLVVIAIISVLAAMIIPVVGAVNRNKQIKLAQTQLAGLVLAIDNYKAKLGFYPPDNPNNPVTNQLYFELLGTTNHLVAKVPDRWVTLDGSAQISSKTAPTIKQVFNVDGIANSGTRVQSDDAGSAASTFLNNLTPNQIGTIDPANPNIKILVCSVTWPPDKMPAPIQLNPSLNPFRYISSHPTNNANSYDLWVDVVTAGKTNRVCNWSTQPIKL